MRNHYWSCSKFADWLRGTASPTAETSKGWREWTARAKKAHPVRYWLADDGLTYLQNFIFYIPDKLYDIKYYVNNRWVTRTHALTAHPRDIKPGSWLDVGNRFLYCLFNELVDFVEVEQAWSHVAWNQDAYKQFAAPWYTTGWFRWRTWRSPAAGIASIDWARGLKQDDEWTDKDSPEYGQPTYQAIRAQEILDLYYWWTVYRPMRVDPMEATGWTAYCETRWGNGRGMLDDLDDLGDDAVDTNVMHEKMRELEDKYSTEDEAMMIRLIKIRDALWT